MRLVLIFPLLALFSPVFAQDTDQVIFRFLSLPGSAHQAGLGGMHVAMPDADASAIVSNPAYLNLSHAGLAGISRTDFFGDVRYSSASYITRFQGAPVAFSIRWMNYGDLQRIDETGSVLGDLSAYDAVFSVTSAKTFSGGLTAGASAGLVHARYGDINASAMVFSGGVLYRDSTQQMTLGLSITNAGRVVKGFYGERMSLFRSAPDQKMPLDIRAGLSKRPEHVPVRLHFGLHSLHQLKMPLPTDSGSQGTFAHITRHLFGGIELLFSRSFVFRAGFDKNRYDQHRTDEQFNGSGLSLGLGINLGRWEIDLARSNYANSGNVVQLGVQTQL